MDDTPQRPDWQPVEALQQQGVEPTTDSAAEHSATEALPMHAGYGLVSAGLLSLCPLVRCIMFLLVPQL